MDAERPALVRALARDPVEHLGRHRLVAAVPVRAGPRLAKERGAEGATTVEEDLHRADPQPLVAGAGPLGTAPQPLDRLVHAERRLRQRHRRHTHGQLVRRARRPVRGELVGEQRRVDDAGDAGGVVLGLDARERAASVVERRRRHDRAHELDRRPLDEQARRHARLVARDHAADGIRRAGADAGALERGARHEGIVRLAVEEERASAGGSV